MRKREYLMRGPSGAVVKFASEAARETVTEASDGEHKIRRRRATFFLGVSQTYDAWFANQTPKLQRLIAAGLEARLEVRRLGLAAPHNFDPAAD